MLGDIRFEAITHLNMQRSMFSSYCAENTDDIFVPTHLTDLCCESSDEEESRFAAGVGKRCGRRVPIPTISSLVAERRFVR